MIIQNVRPDRQTVLFSATFPKQIEKLAKNVLKLPLEIVVGARSVANKDITQYIEVHEEDDKFLRLLQLLGIWNERGSVLIFVDKQEKCDQLFQDLLKAGYPCLSLHGGKDQLDRDHTLHEFKTLIKTVMVATSVAGRGLDVPEIVCVVNYNCPNHIEDYVHRIGRTGRAGRKGTAYTFIAPNEEQFALVMCKALEQAEQPIPAELQSMSDQFKEKVSKGEAKWSTSGFVGKGFTFEAEEMNESQKLASMQRRAYEIEQGIISGDPKDDAEEVDNFYDDVYDLDELESDIAPVPVLPPTAPAAPLLLMASAPPEPQYNESSVISSSTLAGLTPIERAKALAASLGMGAIKSAAAVGAAAAAVTPKLGAPPVSADGSIDPRAAVARARLLAMQMSAGPNAAGGGGEAAAIAHFSEEFEINDYPPQVSFYYFKMLLL
jgi:hypothetical protein